ncbi:MAG: putative methyltransferase [Segetibacter sp.]|jgi:demethylmenaquinone methyltransferase/2-methoxy-6-polyprenyl-1,4-benzoquinol methylase|nr:putative methyltransferase [Segetibacter sp.]
MYSDLISYYEDRAKEYEKIYSKAERQSDLLVAAQILQDLFAGKRVFEIACGTGYWTEIIAKTAHSIVATDINDAVIEVAKSKIYSPANVNFQIADLFKLENTNKYDSLFGGFIWSHILLQDLNTFIDIANSLAEKGGTVVFMDNNYVDGSNLSITGKDSVGNTYQTRTLENGTTHQILKNFPSEIFIRQLLANKVSDLNFINLQYYWIMKYRVL